MIVTRFAPSPTGRLHLGHAYAALVAHELAVRHGGRFLLRFEDIDHTRVREHFYAEIEDDLAWLGLNAERPTMRQSERGKLYEAVLNRLRDLKVVYPCFCTRREIQEELANLAHAPQGPEGPIYPGTCREKTTEEVADLFRIRIPCWRFHSQRAAELTGPLSFVDLKLGRQEVQTGVLGDVILARSDIGTSYHLAVVVDDAAQGVTHVTRGDDLLASTHIHRVLQTLLDLPEPTYLHHGLVLDEYGQRLAKRHDALSLRAMRSQGLSRDQVCHFGELPTPTTLATLVGGTD